MISLDNVPLTGRKTTKIINVTALFLNSTCLDVNMIFDRLKLETVTGMEVAKAAFRTCKMCAGACISPSELK